MGETVLKEDKRKKWIDFMRGLGMILVILGHCGIPAPFYTCIYMFHMPLFYYISGLCHKRNGYSDKSLKQISQKMIKRYIVPYLLFSMLGICLTVIFHGVYGLMEPYSTQLANYAIGIILARGNLDYTGNWGAVWFLISEVCLMGMVYVIEKLNKRFRCLAIVLVILAWPINTLLRHLLSTIWLPFNIGAALTGLLIFYLGYLYAILFNQRVDNLCNDKKINNTVIAIIGIAFIIAGVFIGLKNNTIVVFANNSYGNVGIMYVSSATILVGITTVMKAVYHCSISCFAMFRAIEWIGRNTIPFLGIHGMTIPISRLLSMKMLCEVKWYTLAIFTLLIDSIIILIFNNVRERITGGRQ